MILTRTTENIKEICRNADIVTSESLTLGSDDKIPAFYGIFNYTAQSEVEIPEGALASEECETKFTPIIASDTNNNSNPSSIISGFLIAVATALVVALIVKFYLPSVNSKISEFNYSPLNIIKCFGIGLLIFLCLWIAILVLLISEVGAKLGFIFLLFTIFAYLVSIPIFTISISDILKTKLNIEKTYIYYLLVILVALILHALSLIPVFGGLLSFAITHVSVGLYFKTLHKKVENKEVIENNN